MKITSKRLRVLIKESIEKLLLEDVADKAAIDGGLPEDSPRVEDLRIASGKPYRLQKPELVWLARYFASPEGSNSEEPIADIASAISLFNRSKMLISKLKISTDINSYDSPNDLRRVLARTQGKVTGIDLEKEMDYLGKFGSWHVTMPHTREAACALGEGTTWCTAVAKKGNNLFYNYVMSGQGIILYHIIHDDVYLKDLDLDTEVPANSKISIGTQHGEIFFPEQGRGYGQITVNADNEGVSRSDFENIVGKPVADQIIQAINDSAESTQGSHPARVKIEAMLQDAELLKQELRGKSFDAKLDTVTLILKRKDELERENYSKQRRAGIFTKDIKGIQALSSDVEAFIKDFFEKHQEKYFENNIKKAISYVKDYFNDGAWLPMHLEEVLNDYVLPITEDGMDSEILEYMLLPFEVIEYGKTDDTSDDLPDALYKQKIERVEQFVEALQEAGFSVSADHYTQGDFFESLYNNAHEVDIIDVSP